MQPTTKPLLEITGVHKAFGTRPILSDINLSVAEGEIVCLLGPSGSGKTTLLRIVAGLETADRGDVRFDGRDLGGVPVHARGFGLMFQDLALFPHRNVFENVAFGLRMQGTASEALGARVRETLALVGLSDFGGRDVNLLSGGEQQRVALARALAPRPRLLMFDEPLGALDRLLREQLIAEIRAILKRVGITALYVTHDQAEALVVADRIAILHEGRIVQAGEPETLYRAPANAFVARFLDLGAVVGAEWLAAHGARGLGHGDQGGRGGRAPTTSGPEGSTAYLIRPERVRLVAEQAPEGMPGIVRHCRFARGAYWLAVDVDGARLESASARRIAEGQRVRVTFDAEAIGG